jgi:hypothetical protein
MDNTEATVNIKWFPWYKYYVILTINIRAKVPVWSVSYWTHTCSNPVHYAPQNGCGTPIQLANIANEVTMSQAVINTWCYSGSTKIRPKRLTRSFWTGMPEAPPDVVEHYQTTRCHGSQDRNLSGSLTSSSWVFLRNQPRFICSIPRLLYKPKVHYTLYKPPPHPPTEFVELLWFCCHVYSTICTFIQIVPWGEEHFQNLEKQSL